MAVVSVNPEEDMLLTVPDDPHCWPKSPGPGVGSPAGSGIRNRLRTGLLLLAAGVAEALLEVAVTIP